MDLFITLLEVRCGRPSNGGSPGHDIAWRGRFASGANWMRGSSNGDCDGYSKNNRGRAMQWYKHYIADYLQDTADLSVIEHGVYRLLLDAYYQREGPLPSDFNILYRLCHAHSRHEKAAVRTVVGRFTETLNGHLRVSRADKEILKYQQQCSANRRPNRPRIVGESDIELRERELREKETNKLEASSGEPLSAVALIPLIGKKEWPVSPQFLAELETAYPQVDGPATLKEIRLWCISNPTKRKTERGVMRFINRWFERTQNA